MVLILAIAFLFPRTARDPAGGVSAAFARRPGSRCCLGTPWGRDVIVAMSRGVSTCPMQGEPLHLAARSPELAPTARLGPSR